MYYAWRPPRPGGAQVASLWPSVALYRAGYRLHLPVSAHTRALPRRRGWAWAGTLARARPGPATENARTLQGSARAWKGLTPPPPPFMRIQTSTRSMRAITPSSSASCGAVTCAPRGPSMRRSPCAPRPPAAPQLALLALSLARRMGKAPTLPAARRGARRAPHAASASTARASPRLPRFRRSQKPPCRRRAARPRRRQRGQRNRPFGSARGDNANRPHDMRCAVPTRACPNAGRHRGRTTPAHPVDAGDGACVNGLLDQFVGVHALMHYARAPARASTGSLVSRALGALGGRRARARQPLAPHARGARAPAAPRQTGRPEASGGARLWVRAGAAVRRPTAALHVTQDQCTVSPMHNRLRVHGFYLRPNHESAPTSSLIDSLHVCSTYSKSPQTSASVGWRTRSRPPCQRSAGRRCCSCGSRCTRTRRQRPADEQQKHLRALRQRSAHRSARPALPPCTSGERSTRRLPCPASPADSCADSSANHTLPCSPACRQQPVQGDAPPCKPACNTLQLCPSFLLVPPPAACFEVRQRTWSRSYAASTKGFTAPCVKPASAS